MAKNRQKRGLINARQDTRDPRQSTARTDRSPAASLDNNPPASTIPSSTLDTVSISSSAHTSNRPTASSAASSSTAPAETPSLDYRITIGIAIGSLILGLLLAAMVWCFATRVKSREPRRRRRRSQRQSMAPGSFLSLSKHSGVDQVERSEADTVDDYLPQPLDDKAMSKMISSLSTRIMNHCQSYYHIDTASQVRRGDGQAHDGNRMRYYMEQVKRIASPKPEQRAARLNPPNIRDNGLRRYEYTAVPIATPISDTFRRPSRQSSQRGREEVYRPIELEKDYRRRATSLDTGRRTNDEEDLRTIIKRKDLPKPPAGEEKTGPDIISQEATDPINGDDPYVTELTAMAKEMDIPADALKRLLDDPKSRLETIQWCISRTILRRMELGAKVELTLLPPDFVRIYHQAADAFSGDEKVRAAFLNRWRCMTATMLGSVYDRHDLSPSDDRLPQIDRAVRSLDTVIGQFANEEYDNLDRLLNLAEVVKRGAKVAFTLFSQAAPYGFDWMLPERSHGQTRVAFPSMYQITEDGRKVYGKKELFGEW